MTSPPRGSLLRSGSPLFRCAPGVDRGLNEGRKQEAAGEVEEEGREGEGAAEAFARPDADEVTAAGAGRAREAYIEEALHCRGAASSLFRRPPRWSRSPRGA